MMKKMNFKFFNVAMLLVACSLFMVSCDKDEPKVEEKSESKIIKEKDVQDYGKWYYFSFEKDKFVGEGDADPAKGDDENWSKRTDWDIAFHTNNVRTNSGTSGVGKGGIMEVKTEDFNAVTEVPSNNFEIDKIVKGSVILSISKMPPPTANASISVAPNEWVQHVHGKGWILEKKNVFIVRTADGKYAKIQFVNFLNDESKSKFITMKYAYQKDGSTKFE